MLGWADSKKMREALTTLQLNLLKCIELVLYDSGTCKIKSIFTQKFLYISRICNLIALIAVEK